MARPADIHKKITALTAGFGDILAEYIIVIILRTTGGVKRLSQNFQTVKPRFWVFFFTSLFIVLFILYGALQLWIRNQQRSIEELSREYAALRQNAADLQEKIDYTYTDEFIEREARRSLKYVREGETLYLSGGASRGE